MNFRVLIFEPDAAQAAALAPELAATGCDFAWCSTWKQAARLLRSSRFDAVVACASAEGSAFEGFDQILRLADGIPLLISTRADELEERLHGLRRGAFDYLVRPYGATELVVRVMTGLRLRENARSSCVVRGKVILDRTTGRLGDGATWTILSPRESEVFSMLLGCRGQPVSKERLKSALYSDEAISDNAIEVGIYRLRSKTRPWGMHIRSHRGLGYSLEEI